MAVSKRTRYEVLRRDNHACRYCGGIAPDVILTVDHVTPVALGGSDDPANLVAACRDCNAGKASSSPDATLVADVDQDAIRWAAALRAALSDTGDLKVFAKYKTKFVSAWQSWTFGGRTLDLPAGYLSGLEHWMKLGVPIETVTHAVDMAMDKSTVRADQKFRYVCGIVWRTVDDARAKAGIPVERKLAPQRCGHCAGCDYVKNYGNDGESWTECRLQAELAEDEDPTLCRHCGREDCHFEDGWLDGEQYGWRGGCDAGEKNAWKEAHKQYRPEFLADLALRMVIDRAPSTTEPGPLSLGITDAEKSRRDLQESIDEHGTDALVAKAGEPPF